MMEIKSTQFYTVSTFVIPFYFGSGTVINYDSGTVLVLVMVLVPVLLRQKVTVPVPQDRNTEN